MVPGAMLALLTPWCPVPCWLSSPHGARCHVGSPNPMVPGAMLALLTPWCPVPCWLSSPHGARCHVGSPHPMVPSAMLPCWLSSPHGARCHVRSPNHMLPDKRAALQTQPDVRLGLTVHCRNHSWRPLWQGLKVGYRIKPNTYTPEALESHGQRTPQVAPTDQGAS